MSAALVELELQDLPGLVRPASTRGVLPPQVTTADAAPLAVFVDQCNEWLRITPVERIDRGPQLVDHTES